MDLQCLDCADFFDEGELPLAEICPSCGAENSLTPVEDFADTVRQDS